MSQQSAQKSALGKWAFKNWYPVYSPTIFNEVPVGEAPAEEVGKLLNRTIGVTLFDITKDLSHLTIKLTFQIDRVEGDRAFTRFKEMELARDYIRSLVRRGSSKVEASDVEYVSKLFADLKTSIEYVEKYKDLLLK